MLRALATICIISVALIGFSSLSFFPIPWPDDAVFHLAGSDLLQWPPVYRMRAQSMTVPSYEFANFNMMPLLPLIMASSLGLGFSSLHVLRFLGLIVFALWAFFLGKRFLRHGEATGALFVTLVAITSPLIRWGSATIHTEVWVGAIWSILLFQFQTFHPWKIAGLLAIAAGFHFEAVVWVAPTALAVFPWNSKSRLGYRLMIWASHLWAIAWRTLVCMTPWLIYIAFNFQHFLDQMRTQFGRLEGAHPFLNSFYGFFHSLFLNTGSPTDIPKFFNFGKMLIWVFILSSLARLLWCTQKSPQMRATFVAAIAGVLSSFLLWVDKPETWFLTLVHMALIPVFGLALVTLKAPLRRVAYFFASVLIILQSAVAVSQWRSTRNIYTWEKYEAWVECLDRTIGERRKVWVPTSLDPLVSLNLRNRKREYYSHNCFPEPYPMVQAHAKSMESIIHTKAFPPTDPRSRVKFQGPASEADLKIFNEDPWLQYPEFQALKLGPPWRSFTCHVGPFWGLVSLKSSQ